METSLLIALHGKEHTLDLSCNKKLRDTGLGHAAEDICGCIASVLSAEVQSEKHQTRQGVAIIIACVEEKSGKREGSKR